MFPHHGRFSALASPKPKLSVVIFLLFAVLVPSAARAHAHLDHGTPAVGSTVATPPRELTLTFTQNLEPAFSAVEVTDGGGARVDTGTPQVSGNIMSVGLKPLTPGTYDVRWNALSIDTHKTEGSFTFTVGGR
jgi:methionine-rich copper-binding protein CopC